MSAVRLVKDKIADFARKQLELDRTIRPDLQAFKASKRLYKSAWQEYLDQTKANVETLHKDLDYYDDLDTQEAARAASGTKRGRPVDGGKLQIQSAAAALNKAAKMLKGTLADAPAPHFEAELLKLAREYPDASPIIQSLPHHPEGFSKLVMANRKTLGKELEKKLLALPYRHPARTWLALPWQLQVALNRKSTNIMADAHRHAPTVCLSNFRSFVLGVWERRLTASWQELYLAALIVTGRRKVDLGYVVNFNISKLPGHLKADTLSKKKKVYNDETGEMETPLLNFDFPVVFIKPAEALELINLLRKSLPLDFQQLQNIKEQNNSELYDKLMSSVRYSFQKYFPIEIHIPGKQKDGTLVRPSVKRKFNVHKTIRAIYIKAAEHFYFESKTYEAMSNTAFANAVIGHQNTDFKATMAYLGIRIKNDLDSKPIEKTPYKGRNFKTKNLDGQKIKLDQPQNTHQGQYPEVEILLNRTSFDKILRKLKKDTNSMEPVALTNFIKENIHRNISKQQLLNIAKSTQLLEIFLTTLRKEGIFLKYEDEL